jgi:hypothetical protein
MNETFDIGDLAVGMGRDDFDGEVGTMALARLAVHAPVGMRGDGIHLRVVPEDLLRTPRDAQPAGLAERAVQADLVDAARDDVHDYCSSRS